MIRYTKEDLESITDGVGTGYNLGKYRLMNKLQLKAITDKAWCSGREHGRDEGIREGMVKAVAKTLSASDDEIFDIVNRLFWDKSGDRRSGNIGLMIILGKLIAENPGQRFSQVLSNFCFVTERDQRWENEFYLESQDLLNRVNGRVKELYDILDKDPK